MARFFSLPAIESARAWIQVRPWVLLAIGALLLGVQIGDGWHPTGDGCCYLSMARSMARGGEVTNLGSQHLWFPPGYPALLSPFFLLGDRPFLAISAFQWLLATSFMVGVYVWARRTLPQAAVWIALASVINMAFWFHYRRTLSEIAFMSVCIWTITALQAATTARRAGAALCAIITAGALAGAMCLIRPAGIALAVGFALALLLAAWRQRLSWPRATLLALVVGSSAAAAVGYVVLRDRASAQRFAAATHLDDFAIAQPGFLLKCAHGLQGSIADVGRVVVPGMLKCHGQYGDWLDPNMVIHLPLFGLLFAGWWRWVRRQADPFAWALPCYFALCTAYGMDSGARLLVPLVPALLVCLWLGLECLGWRPARILATAITLHLVFALGYWLAIDRPEARWLARQWPAVDTLAAQVRTAPGPIVMHDCNPELALMLELALDQWVDLNSADSRILRQAQWTIGPEDLRRPERMAFRNAPDSGGALSR